MMAQKNDIVLDFKDIRILLADWVSAVKQILYRFQYFYTKDFYQWATTTQNLIQISVAESSTELLEQALGSYTKALKSLEVRFERLSEKIEKRADLRKALDESMFFVREDINSKQIVKKLQEVLANELKLLDFNDELKRIEYLPTTFRIDLEELAGPFRYTNKFWDAAERLESKVQEDSDKLTSGLREKIEMLFESVEKNFGNMMPLVEKQLQEAFRHIKALETTQEYLDNFDDTETEIEQIENLLRELRSWDEEIKGHLRLFKEDDACLEALEEPGLQISSDDKETLEHLFGKHGKALHTRLRLPITDLDNQEVIKAKISPLYIAYQKRLHTASSKIGDVFDHACNRLNGIWEALQGENDD